MCSLSCSRVFTSTRSMVQRAEFETIPGSWDLIGAISVIGTPVDDQHANPSADPTHHTHPVHRRITQFNTHLPTYATYPFTPYSPTHFPTLTHSSHRTPHYTTIYTQLPFPHCGFGADSYPNFCCLPPPLRVTPFYYQYPGCCNLNYRNYKKHAEVADSTFLTLRCEGSSRGGRGGGHPGGHQRERGQKPVIPVIGPIWATRSQ